MDLDQVPWVLRLFPAAVGIAVAAYVTGVIDGWVIAILIFVTLLPIPLYFAARRLRGIGQMRGEEAWYKVLEIEVRNNKGEEAAGELARLVSERSQKSSVRIAMLSVLEKEMRRSFIILVSSDRGALNIEAEVMKTLVSSLVDGIRAVELNDDSLKPVASWLHALGLRSRGLLLISGESLGERQPFRDRSEAFSIGEALDESTPRPFTLTRGDLEGHIGIFGSTGSGKSTTLSVIAEMSWKSLGIPVILLDWTGEHSALLKSRGMKFRELNPMVGEASVNPLESSSDIEHTVSVMVKALSLSPPQAYLLMRAIESARPRSLRELEDVVLGLPEESKWDREVKRALLRKISMLTRGSYAAFAETRGIELKGVTLIRLDYMKNVIARKSYVLFFLSKLFLERASGDAPTRSTLIAIDEAHNIFGGEESAFIEQLFAECRKYGIMLMIATQSPSQVPNGVLLNTNTKIVHALRSSRDKSVIAETMSLKREYMDLMDKLGPGEAVVQSPSSPEPTLVQILIPEEESNEIRDVWKREPIDSNPDVPVVELPQRLRKSLPATSASGVDLDSEIR